MHTFEEHLGGGGYIRKAVDGDLRDEILAENCDLGRPAFK